jgi:hypothetical protein
MAPGLMWSLAPGPSERHLRRRHENVLFPPTAQAVRQDDIEDARNADGAILESIISDLRSAFKRVTEMPSQIDFAEAKKLMLQLDKLRENCIAEGTEGIDWVPRIDVMETVLNQTIEAAIANDVVLLAKYRQADEIRLGARMQLDNPVVIELLRVPPHDFVASVASADPAHIAMLLAALSGTASYDIIRDSVAQLLLEAVENGFPRDEASSRLAVLGY